MEEVSSVFHFGVKVLQGNQLRIFIITNSSHWERMSMADYLG